MTAAPSLYAVMMKDSGNALTGDGWLWAEYGPSGSVTFSVSNRGSACTSCTVWSRVPNSCGRSRGSNEIDDTVFAVVLAFGGGAVVARRGAPGAESGGQGTRVPFSSAQFSERQSEYGRAFGSGQIYTPQLMVAGRIDAIGNDASAVRQALVRAAQAPHATLSVTSSRIDGGKALVRVVVSETPAEVAAGTVDIVVAVVEDGLVTDVPRGENARNRLRHDAVARLLGPIGTMPPAASSAG